MNLDQLTLPQLKQLSGRIDKEIGKRQSASKAVVLRKLQKLVREHGLSLDEVMASPVVATPRKARSKTAAPAKAPLPVKFRHPNNRELAWSGRGRKPHWVEAWLANGGSLDALAVAAQKLARQQPDVA
ncbi:H-NS family nucleoid-associated regulatory protein [Aromatoleum buckelii]|uniref:H-NS histone family protein n=1 Tax=Aromatoleum buckelii TaxID=200254 RepID=A0ABX1N827_9RHOO|nr:H-NS histone family protein [Aromatoleum buckelii]MCK0509517.1 H-NS histone family protein [Aromatoleum buckelii]